MLDLRPVGYVIGFLITLMGLTMVAPLLVDIAENRGQWPVFAQSMMITVLTGVLIALGCQNSDKRNLNLQQTFLLTTGVWLVLPLFGALPFMLGETRSGFTDAFFEAMSGLTTTGSTVLVGLDEMSKGLLLWRGIMQWLGGVGIIVVAMVFLPELRVGGMQIFKSEGFDTFGKILPRATQISSRISSIYISMTLICAVCYILSGMGAFDATVHAMTTVATGGFANSDASFAAFGARSQYICVCFMLLAALPFVRFVQLTTGQARPLLRDPQIRGFFLTIGALVLVLTVWQMRHSDDFSEPAFREVLFNTTSLMTGTGYASADYMIWGSFAVTVLFFTGLIGGCAGSTACSIKVFRYQILFAAIKTQLRALQSPHAIYAPRYAGKKISDDVINSVMAFFVFFVVTLGVLSVALGLTGLDFVTSVSGASAALANIGPGLGDIIGPAGNFELLNPMAKWMLIAGMLIGRLELLAVYALFTMNFWRA